YDCPEFLRIRSAVSGAIVTIAAVPGRVVPPGVVPLLRLNLPVAGRYCFRAAFTSGLTARISDGPLLITFCRRLVRLVAQSDGLAVLVIRDTPFCSGSPLLISITTLPAMSVFSRSL